MPVKPEMSRFSKGVSISSKNAIQLQKISSKMKLGLTVDEMEMLRSYFASIKREPTEVELHAMAQAWSEHCCYKSSKFYLKSFLSGLREDYVILAMEDDAGVVKFDEDYVYVLKMESHNHPSAIEPYGGAATGVGGIIRDVLCMGAQPVALLDSLFFGNIRKKDNLGTLDEGYIFNQVVAGIRDYGNRMGIPTVSGSITFDRSYSANPLVNAGCIGIARADRIVRSRVSRVGDVLVIAGGKTGRDGIHGVNFASKTIAGNREEEIASVQLGNPVVEEALTHAVLEASDAGILDGMKDLGGGGLSSSVGELCYSGGVSALIQLDKVPLREKEMLPWEIWISESQERMLFAVSRENLPKLDAILDSWDLDHAEIGTVREGRNLQIMFRKEMVLDLDLAFMTSGPIYSRNYTLENRNDSMQIQPKEPSDLSSFLLNFLHDLNICSREPVVRTYDFTVRGGTVVAPLEGDIGSETHSDAAVIKPLENSFKGLVLTSDTKPLMVSGDPYRGMLNTLSEAYRNIISTGGIPHTVVDSLNYGNPENPEIMGQVVESLRAMRDFCSKLRLPVVSGNVSLYNEGPGGNIRPSPVIFMVGLMDDIRSRRPSFFTAAGNHVFIVGRHSTDLSGSYLLHHLGYERTGAPFLPIDELAEISSLMRKAAESRLILSAHDISDGGLAVALCEMTFGHSIGAKIDLSEAGYGRPLNRLFSEGGNRIIVEIEPGKEKEFSQLMGQSVTKIGVTGGDSIEIEDSGIKLIDVKVEDARSSWNSGLLQSAN